MQVKIYIYLFFVITVAFSTNFDQATKSGQTGNAEEVLTRKIKWSETESLTTTNALSRVLANTKVPGGIVRVFDCSGEPIKQEWEPKEYSLNNALDALVSSDPQYHWELDNGVINFLPNAGSPAFLEVRIKELRVPNATSVIFAYNELMLLPEVRKAVIDFGLTDSFERFQGPTPDKSDFNISCKDVTLREALNAIVRVDGKAVWAYHENHCNGRNSFSIEFIVR